MRALCVLVLAPLVLSASAGAVHAQSASLISKDAKIRNALSAAPAPLTEEAAVMDWDNTTLRLGGNGWTCFPDVPNTPGNDPMCLDAQWVNWAHAWMNHSEPQITQVGLAYMLQGGSDASNTDPFATEPAPGEEWIDSGPHLMILVPDLAALESLPTDPMSGGPYVMWKGTPYAHIMVPVGNP